MVNSFAIGVVVLSAIILGFIYYDLSITKSAVANQIVGQKIERMRSELDEFFLPVQQLMITAKEHISNNSLSKSDEISKINYFIPVIKEFPQVSSVGMASSSGFELDILPDTINNYWLVRKVFVEEWGMIEQWTRWNYTDQLKFDRSWQSDLKIDPRERSWFTGASTSSESETYWTEPYLFVTRNNIGITASMRYPDRSGQNEFDILAFDITLQDLTELSQNLNLSDRDEIYLLTEDLDVIVGLPQKYKNTNIDTIHSNLLSNPIEFGNEALIQLMKSDLGEIVSFNSLGETFWGAMEHYPISSTKNLVVAVLIPERDFSSSINRTQSFMGVGFIMILLLSSLLFRNNRKLREKGYELNQINLQIEEQKQQLLSEVHHRVKNNLAIMSALMEMENMMIDDPSTNHVLDLIQSRIRSMASVHEVLYKSDKFNRIQIHEILPGIVDPISKKHSGIQLRYTNLVDPVMINVNQALTYALLINELLNFILKNKPISKNDGFVEILVKNSEERIYTDIRTDMYVELNRKPDDIGQELIQVLLAQLNADIDKTILDLCDFWSIEFKMDNRKGITSDKNF